MKKLDKFLGSQLALILYFTLFIIIIFFLSTACKTVKETRLQNVNTEINTSVNTKQTVKLILEKQVIDSAGIMIKFKCDSLNNVVINELMQTTGELISLKSRFYNGQLNITGITDTLKWYRKEITRLDSINRFQKRDSIEFQTIPVNFLTPYQQFATDYFTISIIIILIFIVYFIYSKFFKK